MRVPVNVEFPLAAGVSVPKRWSGSPTALTLDRGAALAIVAVSCVWLLTVLLLDPAREFPLDDDWSYARAVQSLVENGRLELTGFTSMPLISQVLWGSMFSLPFGFSFTALRISTITLGLVGLLATYGLLREMRVSGAIAILAVTVLAFNPIFLLLSFTFMTDVPFLAFSVSSLLFLTRAVRTEKRLDFIAGYAFGIVAMLIRQPGIIIPISFLVACLVKNGLGLKAFRHGFIPTGASVFVLLAYPSVLSRTTGLPELYNRSFEPINEALSAGPLGMPLVFADRLFIALVYLGLFLIPFSIALAMGTRRSSKEPARRPWKIAGPVLFAAMLGSMLWQGRSMPVLGNVLFDIGLGPALLRDTYLLRLSHWPAAPGEFWLFVTAVAVLGGTLLFRQLLTAVGGMFRAPGGRPNAERAQSVFLISAVALYAGLAGATGFMDRYLIWLMPPLMAVLSAVALSVRVRPPASAFGIALAVMLAYGGFAVGGTHDYLAWNQARWQALTDLMEKDRVSHTDIDGGFEFNGWYGYDSAYQQAPGKSWWWVTDDKYMVSLGPVPGYVELRRYPFDRWIPPERGDIFVLNRAGEPANGDTAVR